MAGDDWKEIWKKYVMNSPRDNKKSTEIMVLRELDDKGKGDERREGNRIMFGMHLKERRRMNVDEETIVKRN